MIRDPKIEDVLKISDCIIEFAIDRGMFDYEICAEKVIKEVTLVFNFDNSNLKIYEEDGEILGGLFMTAAEKRYNYDLEACDHIWFTSPKLGNRKRIRVAMALMLDAQQWAKRKKIKWITYNMMLDSVGLQRFLLKYGFHIQRREFTRRV